MLRTLRLVSLVGLVVLSAHGSFAQVTTGTPPFGSFSGSPDIVNLGNLNVHLAIPVFSRPGRGTPFFYNLQYDSSIWYPVTVGGTTTWQPVQNWGLLSQTAVSTGVLNVSIYSYTCYTYISLNHTWVETGQTNQYTWNGYTDAFGALHPLNTFSQFNWGSCNGINYPASSNSGTVTANDGSGYTFWTTNYSTPNLTSRDGTVINAPENVNGGAGSFTDRNGNQVTVDASGHFYDTMSSSVPVLTISGSGTPSSPLNLTYTAPSGATPAFTLNYTNYTIATNFGISNVHEYKSSGPVPLVTSAVLADGSHYTFTYEATPSTPSGGACTPYGGTTCVTARLTSVTLPTGGTINYAYSGGNNGIYSDGSTATLGRTTPDGAWSYAQSKGSGAASATTVTDPQGNQTVIQFQKGIYETQRQNYQGSSSSGTLLRTRNTCYNYAAFPCTSTAITLPISHREVDTTLPGGLKSHHAENWNSVGLPTWIDEYDFGNGAYGALIKRTLISYASLGNNILSPPQSIVICNGTGNSGQICQNSGTLVSETTFNYDETAVVAPPGASPQHVSISGSRGNQTSIHTYTNSTSYLTKTMTYFDTGNVQTVTDVNGAQTTFNFPDATSTCGNAFPTSVTEPLTMSRSMTWSCTGGVQLTAVDENTQQTTIVYNDPYFWRPAEIDFPDGGQTKWTYNSQTSTTMNQKMDNTPRYITSTVLLDGLGRTIHQQLNSDPEGVDYTDTTYDSLGRVASESNPYRSTSDPTYGITSYVYDALSRICVVVPPDGTTLSGSTCPGSQPTNDIFTTYSGASTTVTDQAGKKRSSTINSLGFLTRVTEDPGGLGYLSSYTYDPLGNITGVAQNGGRQRTFVYDFLSRLTSETNPESGAITYGYDSGSAGDLTSLVAPAPNQTGSATVTTTYSYDALHRMKQKSYSDGITPTSYFSYDMASPWGSPYGGAYKGRLSQEDTLDSAGHYVASHIFVYDPVGRIQETGQCTSMDCNVQGRPGLHTLYSHDLVGNLTSWETVENGITFGYQYDTAGRPNMVTSSLVDPQHPGTLATFNNYWPIGAMRGMSYGNGVNAATMYNNRLQPCRLNWNLNAIVFNTCSDSTPSSTFVEFTYGYNSGSANNGNIVSWSANNQQYFGRTYSYDSLNRLSTMSDGASSQPCRGLTWTYDAWGNRTDQTVTAGTCNTFHNSVNTNNQFSSSPYQYDAAGNMTHDASHSYAYDAENRLISLDGGSTAIYAYDAEGNRVLRTMGSTVVEYIVNPSGQVIHELNGSTGTFNAHYIRVGDQLVAEMANSTTYFVHADHLGSTRLVTNMSEGTAENMDYLPFGEQIAGGSLTTHKFTGDERDSESTLDHTQFRQYSSSLGRWMTPDPAGLAVVDLNNPQSWNRYSYVTNDPLDFVDPSGLFLCSSSFCPPPPPDPPDVGGGGGGGGGIGGAWPCTGFVSFWHAGCPPTQQPPKPPTNPLDACKGVTPDQLDYKSADGQTHIEDRHMAYMKGQSIPIDDLGNGRYRAAGQYLFSPAGTDVQNFALVTQINAITFSSSAPTMSRGNIVFTATLGPQPTVDLPYQRKYIGLGGRESGSATMPRFEVSNTNVLVLRRDCKTVITSYPIVLPSATIIAP